MIASIELIDGLIAGITSAEIQRLPPAHRRRLAQALRYVADLADPPATTAGRAKPKARSGVLTRLSEGERAP